MTIRDGTDENSSKPEAASRAIISLMTHECALLFGDSVDSARLSTLFAAKYSSLDFNAGLAYGATVGWFSAGSAGKSTCLTWFGYLAALEATDRLVGRAGCEGLD